MTNSTSHYGSGARSQTRRRAWQALSVAVLCMLAVDAHAAELTLRFEPQDGRASGYRAYFTTPGGSFGAAAELGSVRVESGGVVSADVPASVIEGIAGVGEGGDVD